MIISGDDQNLENKRGAPTDRAGDKPADKRARRGADPGGGADNAERPGA